jgi:DNA-binding transcriptional LysR family regulator
MAIMELRHLEVVHAVLRAGSVSAAARELLLTQPAVSRSLQQCEQELGLRLFERVAGGPLRATAEARALSLPVARAHRDLLRVQQLAEQLGKR